LDAKRILEHDIRRAARIVGKFFLGVLVFTKQVFPDADADEPVFAPVDPVALVLFPIGFRVDEVFHFHLLEFAGTEDEVARGDFVAEAASLLRDAEGEAAARGKGAAGRLGRLGWVKVA
jgi:hypothetical protein